jgi:hypothetical protein
LSGGVAACAGSATMSAPAAPINPAIPLSIYVSNRTRRVTGFEAPSGNNAGGYGPFLWYVPAAKTLLIFVFVNRGLRRVAIG